MGNSDKDLRNENAELLELLDRCISVTVSEGQRKTASDALYLRCKGVFESMLYKTTYNKHLAQTIYNEAILKLLEKAKSGERIENVSAYLYTLAKGVWLNAIKPEVKNTARVRGLLDHDKSFELADVEYDPSREEKMARIIATGLELLAKQSPEQAAVLSAFYIEELSYVQVSEKYGYSLNQIKSYVQNGKAQLKKLMLQSNLLPQIEDL